MRRGSRALAASVALSLAAGLAACNGDDGTGLRLSLEEVAGLYQMSTLTFDPQGSAPAADIQAALESSGVMPTLNIDLVDSFQLFFKDPVTGSVRTLGGDTRTTSEGIELTFATQAMADEFLFPRRVVLTWDADAGTLAFSGQVQVSRSRLLDLFPVLYGEEQLLDPTPGTMTVLFQAEEASM